MSRATFSPRNIKYQSKWQWVPTNTAPNGMVRNSNSFYYAGVTLVAAFSTVVSNSHYKICTRLNIDLFDWVRIFLVRLWRANNKFRARASNKMWIWMCHRSFSTTTLLLLPYRLNFTILGYHNSYSFFGLTCVQFARAYKTFSVPFSRLHVLFT